MFTKAAAFQEVDIGIAADVGVLQRLPKIIGNESLVRELAFTARNFSGGEARKMGLLSRTFATRQEMISSAIDLAVLIAKKSPVAVQGTKINLNYSRDHTVEEGLDSMVGHRTSFVAHVRLSTEHHVFQSEHILLQETLAERVYLATCR